MFCFNICFRFVESLDFLDEYLVVNDSVFIQKILRFNKPKTDVEAEHTNILYISFQKLFAQTTTCKRVVDICFADELFKTGLSF